ncbi:MAG TPA: amino acid adenylation domain-containing protein [Streptosporangiaceae bacterium]|nr:amino acid adenylation domain-containing protein [Streptosporangiaceae bacterium]
MTQSGEPARPHTPGKPRAPSKALTHELVYEQARRAPTSVAVRDQTGQLTCELTFGDLANLAGRIAAKLCTLRSGLAVPLPDVIIGTCLPRGADFVAAALGILTAGAAYLPIDPANPPARTIKSLTEARTPLVITTPAHVEALSGRGISVLTMAELIAEPAPEQPAAELTPEQRTAQQQTVQHSADHALSDSRPHPLQLAYVIYTSGSTGAPKGVMISHGALLNMVRWNMRDFGLSPADTSTMVASPGFDASVWEIWPSLAAGAAIVIPDEDTRLSPQRMRDWLVAEQVTVSFLPTPLAELVLDLPWPAESKLRVLQTAGDRLHSRPRPDLPFTTVNNYGPAENAVVATAGPVTPGPSDLLPSIGRPVSGVDVALFGSSLELVNDGSTAEIYLGGSGLARGYLHQPGLTAERFVPDPRADRPGGRLYRTGDLARVDEQGELDFRGRGDDQVKIRGNRAEPAEVTAVLVSHPLVSHAVTVTGTGVAGETQLISYYVPADIKRLPGANSLREYLAQRLPSYLVPAELTLLASLPLTANGKINKAALPSPQRPARRTAAAPRTSQETDFVSIWSDVFGTDEIGIHDSFFELGGHSLIAARLAARIRDRLGLDISASEIFARPTIAELADEVARGSGLASDSDARTSLPPLVRVPRQHKMPLSLVQEQIWFLTKLSPGTAAYHAQATIRVDGSLDIGVLERVMTELCRRHETLRTVYGHDSGRAWQSVREAPQFRIPVIDLRGLTSAQQATQAQEIIAAEMRTPFELSRLPLCRWTAVRHADDDWELVVIEHHFVHDGWSFGRLMFEVNELYRAFASDAPSPLPDLELHYIDFACWQRAAMESPGMQTRLEYWREQLTEAPDPVTVLPDSGLPGVPAGRGDRLRAELAAGLPDLVRTFCRAHEVSLFMALLAGFSALLHDLTGATDFCLGSAVANRRFREIEPLLGMFVNNVVLRIDTSHDPTFSELAQRVRDVVLGATANQDVPFAKVVSALNPSSGRAGTPFFRMMFSFHDSPEPRIDFGGSLATLFELHNHTAKVDLELVVLPRAERQMGNASHHDDRITLLWDYDTDMYRADTVAKISDRYQQILAAAIRDPGRRLSHLSHLSLSQHS